MTIEYTPEEKFYVNKYGMDFYQGKRFELWSCSNCTNKEEIFYFQKCEVCKSGQDQEMEKDYIEYKSERLKKKIYTDRVVFDQYIPNAKILFNINPYFYDKSGLFWIWESNQLKYSWADDVDVANFIEKNLGLGGITITKSMKGNYLEACKRVGRLADIKKPKPKYIQFLDKAYNIENGEIWNIEPRFYFTNPIPWEMGDTEDTPVMDKLFKEWVGDKYVVDLYEVIAYCCYASYPIQLIFCLYGGGRNGKSQFIKILNKFIGNENVCSTELDTLIDNRFEAFKLYKKLVCTMGETNFGVMKKTSLLKKLVGGDLIGFEKKNKDPFDDYNYAKIVIATNTLPTSNDTSDGFMRRWHIIDFPNQFEEGTDIMNTIPEKEFNNLARKVCRILPQLIKNGKFTNQGDIEFRRKKYILASNPLPLFLERCCIIDPEGYVSYAELYTAYVFFLNKLKRRRVKKQEFKIALEDEGHYVDKESKKIYKNDPKNGENYGEFKHTYWVDGIRLKNDWKENVVWDICDIWDLNLTQELHKESLSENRVPKVPKIPNFLENDALNSIYDRLIMQNHEKCVKSVQLISNDPEILGMILDSKLKSGEYFQVRPGWVKRV